jgi:hypothetical protein
MRRGVRASVNQTRFFEFLLPHLFVPISVVSTPSLAGPDHRKGGAQVGEAVFLLGILASRDGKVIALLSDMFLLANRGRHTRAHCPQRSRAFQRLKRVPAFRDALSRVVEFPLVGFVCLKAESRALRFCDVLWPLVVTLSPLSAVPAAA